MEALRLDLSLAARSELVPGSICLPDWLVKKKTGTMSSSSGYVTIPRSPVIFYGTNYTEFVGFMRIHMRGLRLWGVLTGEVPCPPRPVPPVVPTASLSRGSSSWTLLTSGICFLGLYLQLC